MQAMTQAMNKALKNIRVGEALSFLNLTVFPLSGEASGEPVYDSLREAVAAGTARIREVSEGGTVPNLLLENSGKRPILIMDGEELIGAKQNRIANVTILAPAGQSLLIPVSCVEAGRWHHVSPAFEVSDRAHFARGRASKTQSVNASLRTAGTRTADQHQVWEEIADKQSRMSVRSPTGAMADIYEQHRARVDDYVRVFTAANDQLGALFAIDGRIQGLDLFDCQRTLAGLFAKLVRSYAIDAVETATGQSARVEVQSARNFLGALAQAKLESYPGVGLGTEVRLSGPGLVAGGLLFEDRLVHLAAFALPAASAALPDEAAGLSAAHIRRQRFGRM